MLQWSSQGDRVDMEPTAEPTEDPRSRRTASLLNLSLVLLTFAIIGGCLWLAGLHMLQRNLERTLPDTMRVALDLEDQYQFARFRVPGKGYATDEGTGGPAFQEVQDAWHEVYAAGREIVRLERQKLALFPGLGLLAGLWLVIFLSGKRTACSTVTATDAEGRPTQWTDSYRAKTTFGPAAVAAIIAFGLCCLPLVAGASKTFAFSMPSDGSECGIEPDLRGWVISRGGSVQIVIGDLGDGDAPVHAVEKNDRLYVEWSSGRLQVFANPQPSSVDRWRMRAGQNDAAHR